jgi:ketosteroid isomerase-like protein
MLSKNKELIKEFNKAFTAKKIEFILDHVSNDIRWNIVGMPVIIGKNDFLKTIEMMDLIDVRELNIQNIIAEGEYVVVEIAAKSYIKGGDPLNASYCSVYRIKDEKIKELTTYIVDTSTNNE